MSARPPGRPGRPARPPRPTPSWPVLLLVLAPLVVLYPLAIVGISDAGMSSGSIAYSFVSLAVASALAVVAWTAASHLPWGQRHWLWLYGAHLVGAVVYALGWWLGTAAVRAWIEGEHVAARVIDALTGPFLFWNLLFGVLIYGVGSGLIYTVRSREDAREQRVHRARAEAVAARAQLTALQARLNPHFLFNALHSLSALIEQDAERAGDAVDHLGDVFRYALDGSGRDSVTFREEWSFVENYLTIEALRIGDRMTVVTDIAPDTLDLRVPPFCLQPLVENAIRHGIAPLARPGTVTIVARVSDGQLRLDVTDDGVGSDAADFETTSGFGLQALRTYLNTEPQLVSSPGAGCKASLLLPVVS